MDPSGQEANPYAYAKCNPINSSDPSGLISGACVSNSLAAAGAGLVLAGEITGAVLATVAPEPVITKAAAWGLAAIIAGTYFGFLAATVNAIESCQE